MLGLGFFAGGSDPNQVEEQNWHESSTLVKIDKTVEKIT